MNDLLFRISQLPQNVQDIIGMYNVHHRKQMKKICQDLEFIQCDECGDYLMKIKSISRSILFLVSFNYCDSKCAWYHERYIRRAHQREAIQQY